MLSQMRHFLGSIINSYLGPFKSYKTVIDSGDSCMIKCPLLILQKTIIKDPFSLLIESALNSHHEQFGCSTATLLAMWYLWHEEFQLALEEGCEIEDIVEYSQKILDETISLIPQITIHCDKTFLPKKSAQKSSSNYKTFKSPNTDSFQTLVKTSFKPALSTVEVKYSSRHFSPFQTKLDSPERNSEDELEKQTMKSPSENQINIDDKARHLLRSLVENLSHDEIDFTNLVFDLWMKQVESENTMKFNIDGVVICAVTLPCSYSSVVDGLIIKSNLSSLYDPDLNSLKPCKALIIKGSILYEYVHLGYTSKVSVTVKKTAEELKTSEKDSWIKKCFSKLLELCINVLLVSGEVDNSILSFCSSNSILVLPRISWKTLEFLCIATDESPCTYLTDCDEENVILSLVIKKWNFEYSKGLNDSQYFLVDINKAGEMVKPHTVFLCHPSNLVLSSLEHQFWHVISRLNLALKSNQLLPGGGRAEEFCSNSIRKNTSKHSSEERIRIAVSNGFMNYYTIVSNKDMPHLEDQKCLDELESKLQAWKSAMCLALAIMQCDCIIVNDSESQIVKEVNKNVIGLL